MKDTKELLVSDPKMHQRIIDSFKEAEAKRTEREWFFGGLDLVKSFRYYVNQRNHIIEGPKLGLHYKKEPFTD